MEVLLRRLEEIETIVDAEGAERSVWKSLELLNTLIDQHIESNKGLKKLILNINKIDLKTTNGNHDEIEYKKSVIDCQIDKINDILDNLQKIKSIEKNFNIKYIKIDYNQYSNELKNLQLRYNYLLIKSINLFQNYLNLNENIKKL